MIQYRKILDLHFSGISQRTISSTVGSSRHTIRSILTRAAEKEVTHLTDDMSDSWLEGLLFPEKQPFDRGYYPINWEYIHKELMKRHMTLRLLHQEYDETAKLANKVPYSYRHFCFQYGDYAKKYKLTMPIRRKPGEIMEVDWAGSTLQITDRLTGEELTAYVFIATLPYSQYSYVEAFLDMKTASWITAHIHAFEFFGKVTESIVPDNLKSGVIKYSRTEVLLNEAYREFADHYKTVIIPARVRTPKDKASVEGTVGFISRRIIASLRHIQAFSIHELNGHILEKLEVLNTESFQKRPGSRKKVYEDEERMYLHSLPHIPFKLSEWRTSKVQLNYHIQVDKMYYSVPYEYIQNQVEVRLTRDLIEVYFKEVRIASHKRLYGEMGQYATLTSHMPDNHRKFLEHSPETLLKWAKDNGEGIFQFVQIILETNIEKQALTMLMSFKQLAKQVGIQELEAACQLVLSISSKPTVALVKTVVNRKKNAQKKQAVDHEKPENDFGFSRGSTYFGGNDCQ